jgi:4-amino-4-deoxy-L-arabinose transferase-like glycosyltransferase
MPSKIPRLLWLALPVAYLLYLFRLTGIGLIGPDEPRYAAIGREMARSGDWITPRLWGQPWFEKPALLYWMSGGAFRLGLGPELAPRLPVALLSIAFLGFFWWIVKREFGCRAASLAAIILGTSAAWIGFSQVGVTDLPLAATFSAAMLLALSWMGKRETRMLPAAAGALGLAVLAKGLLPLALAAPLALRVRWFRDLLRPRVLAPFFAIALPWYVLCYLRNGSVFLHDFILVHHLERFTQTGLQHVQPWWFYIPRLPALLLPWAPLLLALRPRTAWGEPRQRFLVAWTVFGLAFFSASVNKLPGYLLPLLPPLAILMALGLEQARRAGALLVSSALLLAIYPVAVPLVPAAMANLWAGAPRPAFQWTWLLPVVPAIAAWLLEARGRRVAAVAAIASATAIAVGGLKWTAGPDIDRTATARNLARAVAQHPGEVCLEPVRRDWQYGLYYYAGTDLPDCDSRPRRFHIMQRPGFPPELAPAALEGGTNHQPDVIDPR